MLAAVVSNPYRYSTNLNLICSSILQLRRFKSLQVFYKLNLSIFAHLMLFQFQILIGILQTQYRTDCFGSNYKFQILIGILQTRRYYSRCTSYLRVSNPYRYSTNLFFYDQHSQHFKVSNPYRYSTNLSLRMIIPHRHPSFKSLQVFYKQFEIVLYKAEELEFQILIGILQTLAKYGNGRSCCSSFKSLQVFYKRF